MAISFVGALGDNASNGGSCQVDFSIDLPGLAANDLVIVALSVPSASDLNLRAGMLSPGYTYLGSTYSDDTEDCNLAVFMRFMDATVDTIVTGYGPLGAATEGSSMAVLVLRGVDRNHPFDALPVSATGINTALPDPPAITTSGSAAGVWSVIAVGSGHGEGAAAYDTFPTNYTTNSFSIGGSDSNSSTAGVGYNSAPSISEDPAAGFTITSDSTSYSWGAFTFAVRPAQTDPITVVGNDANGSINGGDITLNLPAGTQEGDMAVVGVCWPQNSDITMSMLTSGYTKVNEQFQADSNNINHAVFYKFMGPSPDATAVYDGSGDTATGGVAVLQVFRGVDPANPFGATNQNAQGANNQHPAPAGITPTTSKGMLVISAANSTVTGDQPGFLFQTPFIGRSAANYNDTETGNIGVAYAPVVTAGTIGTQTWYQTGSNGTTLPTVSSTDSWAAITMELNPLSLTMLTPVHAVGSVRV